MPRYGWDPDTLGFDRAPLRAILDFWNQKRGDRRAPARADIDPVEIGANLRNIFLVEVLPDGDYLYRVIGTAIVFHVGFDGSRRKLSELTDKVDTARVARDFDDVVKTFTPRYDFARGPWTGMTWRVYHRLLLPLSADGQAVDFILGCIDLETGTGRLDDA